MNITVTPGDIARAQCGRTVDIGEGLELAPIMYHKGHPQYTPRGWQKFTINSTAEDRMVLHRWLHTEMLADIEWVNWALNASDKEFTDAVNEISERNLAQHDRINEE
jgi:hypothetical protein